MDGTQPIGRNNSAGPRPARRKQILLRAPNARLPKNSQKAPPKISPSATRWEEASKLVHEIDTTERQSRKGRAFRSWFLEKRTRNAPIKAATAPDAPSVGTMLP